MDQAKGSNCEVDGDGPETRDVAADNAAAPTSYIVGGTMNRVWRRAVLCNGLARRSLIEGQEPSVAQTTGLVFEQANRDALSQVAKWAHGPPRPKKRAWLR